MRKSNYELLKIIAIFLIILSHTVPFYGDNESISYVDLNCAHTNFQITILSFFRYFGQLGNAVFIITSAFFLLESRKVKIRKVASIMLSTFLISLTYLIIYAACGVELGFQEILSSLFPILAKQYWFITCYLIIYLLHPILNLIVNNLPDCRLLLFVLLIVLIAILYPTNILYFILYYFLTALFKRNFVKFCNSTAKNLAVFLICLSMYCSSAFIMNFLGLKYTYLSQSVMMLNKLINPCLFFTALSLLNLFGKLDLKNCAINFISSLSLLVYVIHENILFYTYTKPYVFSIIYYNFTYSYIALWCLLGALLTLILSALIAALFKISIGKLIEKACFKLEAKITDIEKRRS